MSKANDVSLSDFANTVLLLDAAQEALDAAAKREERREAGKRMRQVTEQQRAKTTRAHVAKMNAEYSLGLDL